MEDDPRSSLLSRIGTFFFLLAIGGVILFIASDMAEKTNFGYFFIALALLFTGWFFKRTGATPPAQGQRFSGIRRWQQNRREARAKKEASKKK